MAPTASDVLDRVSVRLLSEPERPECDRLLREEHYLQSSVLVGQSLRYVAELDGQWLALITFRAPALQLKARERWIGWTPRQRARRLGLVVNNSRFLVRPERQRYPNLAFPWAGLGSAPPQCRLAGPLGPAGAGRGEFRGRVPLPGHLLSGLWF